MYNMDEGISILTEEERNEYNRGLTENRNKKGWFFVTNLFENIL